MISIGTPLSPSATRVMLLGAGELGKEVAIEFQRLGIEVIAVDRYANAPAMQVAHRSYVIDMLDGDALMTLITREQPHYIVPEIEAIATDVLVKVEERGMSVVVPCARATRLTMDREGIRRLAAETLGLPTSLYRFAQSQQALAEAAEQVGFPCVVKPVMSSSGKGQSVLRDSTDVASAWEHALSAGRGGKTRVIVEGFVAFDYEITLLTVRTRQGTSFCPPVGHRQQDGDYVESWQPQQMSPVALAEAERVAGAITEALGGYGVFGVELFICGDKVFFNEVSPRPHDTGLVTMISQNLSEFALHVRAILGLPVPVITQYQPSASAVVKMTGDLPGPVYGHLDQALSVANTELRLFAKPELHGTRRMGVVLAGAESVAQARKLACESAARITLES